MMRRVQADVDGGMAVIGGIFLWELDAAHDRTFMHDYKDRIRRHVQPVIDGGP